MKKAISMFVVVVMAIIMAFTATAKVADTVCSEFVTHLVATAVFDPDTVTANAKSGSNTKDFVVDITESRLRELAATPADDIDTSNPNQLVSYMYAEGLKQVYENKPVSSHSTGKSVAVYQYDANKPTVSGKNANSAHSTGRSVDTYQYNGNNPLVSGKNMETAHATGKSVAVYQYTTDDKPVLCCDDDGIAN